MSGTTDVCRVSGAQSHAATVAAYAYDTRLRARIFADGMEALEGRLQRRVAMSRNIAALRSIHPFVAGATGLLSLRRMGVEGCALLAEAGPADPVNRWTEQLVFASTETDVPTKPIPTPRVAPAVEPAETPPERGC